MVYMYIEIYKENLIPLKKKTLFCLRVQGLFVLFKGINRLVVHSTWLNSFDSYQRIEHLQTSYIPLFKLQSLEPLGKVCQPSLVPWVQAFATLLLVFQFSFFPGGSTVKASFLMALSRFLRCVLFIYIFFSLLPGGFWSVILQSSCQLILQDPM